MWSAFLTVFLSLLQSVPTCCWPTMHQWRWKMLRDGAPLLRPLAMETDKWVSIWDRLTGTAWEYSKTDLWNPFQHSSIQRGCLLVSLFLKISVVSIVSVGFPTWKWDAGERRCNQQMQINSCLCTFFHAAASKWGHSAGPPPLSPWREGTFLKALWLLCRDERQFIRCFSPSLLIGWLCSSLWLARFLPTVHSGQFFIFYFFKKDIFISKWYIHF